MSMLRTSHIDLTFLNRHNFISIPKSNNQSGTGCFFSQGNTSSLGHTSSSLFEKHFEGDLTEDKGIKSNILVEGLDQVARNLLVSEIRPVNIAEEEKEDR